MLEKSNGQKQWGARLAVSATLVALFIVLLQLGATPVAYAAVGFEFSQCRNGSPATNSCVWSGGNLSSSQATYYEGMGAFQRLMFTSIPSGLAHKIDIQYQFSNQSAKKGYDFLVSWAQAQTLHLQATGLTPTMNQCAGMNPGDTTACNNLTGASGFFLDVSLPDDPYVSDAGDGAVQTRINAFETTYGNRTLRIYSDCPFNGTPTFSISHLTPDTASSDVLLTINYTTRAPTGIETAPNCLTGGNAGVSPEILLQFAGHLALSGGCSQCWGAGKGAAAISGSGWHIRNIEFDDTGGSVDNQIQIAGFNPTAAELTFLSARRRATEGGVRVRWSSGSETNIVGFNVWRKRAHGAWKQQNAGVIPAKKLGQVEGADYEYMDTRTKATNKYKYKIQILHAVGDAVWSDVVTVVTPSK